MAMNTASSPASPLFMCAAKACSHRLPYHLHLDFCFCKEPQILQTFQIWTALGGNIRQGHHVHVLISPVATVF